MLTKEEFHSILKPYVHNSDDISSWYGTLSRNKDSFICLEDKETWLKALLSGEYLQANSRLKIGGETVSFCCLGVYAEVVLVKKGKARYDGDILYYNDCEPYETVMRSGWKITLPYTEIHPDIQNPLGWMNDRGVPFDVIAKIINSFV